jgi:hypothetical protein
MTVVVRTSLALAVVASVVSSHGSVPAHADDDPMAACIASSDRGLDLRKQGKLLEARGVLVACASAGCGPAISAVCERRVAEINALMPSVIFLPRDSAGRDVVGVTMSIDGASERVPLDGRPIAIDPGPHTFRFQAAGQSPVDRSFVIAEGARNRQEPIDLSPVAPPPAAPVSRAPPAAAGPSETGSRTGAWVVGTVGVVGVVAGSVLGALAIAEASASRSDCESSAFCSNRNNAVNEHNTAAAEGTASTIAFAAGGAALVVAAYLFLVPSGSSRSSTGSVQGSDLSLRLEPSFASQSAGLSLRGVFR